jgi:hypothetical protein
MSPETIRAHALECMCLALSVNDLKHRSLLLEMAHRWADLANSFDRFQAFAESAEGTAANGVTPRLNARARPSAKPKRFRAPRRRCIPPAARSSILVVGPGSSQ